MLCEFVNGKAHNVAKLPRAIQNQLDEADWALRTVHTIKEHQRKPEKTKKTRPLHVGGDQLAMEIAVTAIGIRGRGNKRDHPFYIALASYFLNLNKRGITLPNWHLSKAACENGLLEILHAHKRAAEITSCDAKSCDKLLNSYGRIFRQIRVALLAR